MENFARSMAFASLIPLTEGAGRGFFIINH